MLAAALIVMLWPAPDPLKGVESVAFEEEPGIASEVVSGLKFALGDHEIEITNNPDEADAVITLIDASSADFNFSISDEGASGSIHAVLHLEYQDGRTSTMDLFVTLDENGIKAELKGRKFYEAWN